MLSFVLHKLCQTKSGYDAGYDEAQVLLAGAGSVSHWQPAHVGAAPSRFPAVPAAHPTGEQLCKWVGKGSMAYGP